MAYKNIKRSAYYKPNGLRVNCDGTTILDRKPDIKFKPNHFHHIKKVYRVWNPKLTGQAISDGYGWYKS